MQSKRLISCLLAVLILPAAGFSQKWSLSSNMAGIADYGTMNVSASRAVDRHWSVLAGVRYNPFSFPDGSLEKGAVRRKQRAFSVGARYWPWHVYSGWWVSAAAQVQEYNFTRKSKNDTSEGDRYGSSLSAGYSYMVNHWLNIEVGLGLWGGLDIYKVYDCPTCGITVEQGRKPFLTAEDVIVALSIIF